MTAAYISIKEDVLQKVEAHLPEIRERFGVDAIAIFGSVSRGEDTPDSDVDVLYTFRRGKATMANLTGLSDYLEKLFNRSVDLVSWKWISPILLPYIENDIILCGEGMGEAVV